MMTNILRFLFFTILISLISSCTKDIDISDSQFPQIYVYDSYFVGTLKAFTKSGEITDSYVINRYIEDRKDFFWQSTLNFSDWQYEIEILSDSSARISNNGTTNYDLIRKNGLLYFQSKNGIVFSGEPLIDDRFKYSPLYQGEYPVTIGGGYFYIPCFYILESDNELHMPFVSYYHKSYSSNGEFLYYQAKGSFNNAFNMNYLNKIINNEYLIDTVVYQENFVIFKKQI